MELPAGLLHRVLLHTQQYPQTERIGNKRHQGVGIILQQDDKGGQRGCRRSNHQRD